MNLNLISHQNLGNQYGGIGHGMLRHGQDLLYLNYSAPPVIARRIQAYLRSTEHYEHNSRLLWNDTDRIAYPRHVPKYFSAEKALPSGYLNIVLAHPNLSAKLTGQSSLMLMAFDGQERPVGFISRLQAFLTIPILPEWEEPLWKHLIDTKSYLLRELSGSGNVRGWTAYLSSPDQWISAVKAALN